MVDSNRLSPRPSSAPPINLRRLITATWRRIAAASADINAGIKRMSDRQRQRRALALLDRRLLNDIGLSAEIVRDELRRPFWR